MATTASSAGTQAPEPAGGSTGRRVRMALAALFLAGAVVQFYLAGRGAFRAGDYDAHKALGGVLHLVSFLALLATLIFKDLRNRTDIGLAVAFFVLMTIQSLLGNFDHPQLNALHPVNALLVIGAAAGILSRDRRLGGGGARTA